MPCSQAFAVRFNFFSNSGDVNIYSSGGYNHPRRPCFAHQLFTAINMPAMSHEQPQDVKLQTRQLNKGSINFNRLIFMIDNHLIVGCNCY